MKNKLCNLVDIVENNEECVILKIKDDKKIDLIKLGYFDGNEDLIRLTKGENHTCTIFDKDGSTFSWYWGTRGYTLVSESTSIMGKLIEECITEDFDIYIGDDLNKIKDSLYIKSLDDVKNNNHHIKLMYWKNGGDVSVHKDGSFYKFFDNMDSVKEHFSDLNYNMTYLKKYVAPQTGCIVEEYNISKIRELENNSNKELQENLEMEF